jgi:hypothetical protein
MPSHDPTILLDTSSEAEHELFRWSRQRYEDLVSAGFIEEGSRVELLDGYIVHLPVQNRRHSVVQRVLRPSEALSPLARPNSQVQVADLLA